MAARRFSHHCCALLSTLGLVSLASGLNHRSEHAKIGQVQRFSSNKFVVDNAGIFSGMKILTAFTTAPFWGRHCSYHEVSHEAEESNEVWDEEELVFTAVYNGCNGVSDLVYYNIHADKYESGAGRAAGWKDDPKLKSAFLDRGLKTPYAKASHYHGCGMFGIDRGHQAPMATFNADIDVASLTNVPTNLSPQSKHLNEGVWKSLETDMRKKANEIADEDEEAFVEVITGPLYELPRALVVHTEARALWRELLETGGDTNPGEAWCSKRDRRTGAVGFVSKPVETKAGVARMNCSIRVSSESSSISKPSEDPNSLAITFSANENAMPLRVPLGYYSLMAVKRGTNIGRRTCAFIMDQIGQCFLVSVELLSKLAHIDLKGTEFAANGGTVVQSARSRADYSATVNPFFCVPPDGTLRKHNSCVLATANITDPRKITAAHVDLLWQDGESVTSTAAKRAISASRAQTPMRRTQTAMKRRRGSSVSPRSLRGA